jgi:NET1-associated nuclear protein 1 (U3 small nucleolar RNA-associated protein 17)
LSPRYYEALKTAIERINLKTPSPKKEVDFVAKERFKNGSFGSEPLTGLAISPSGTWLVATIGKNVFCVNPANPRSHFMQHTSRKALTCLAFHPSEDFFATGDTDGIIRLWYCLYPNAAPADASRNSRSRRIKKSPTTTLHWHAHPVNGLTFTPNGAYLASGGEEAVLVLWQLGTGHKEFVPRVGAPIEHVTICPKSSISEPGYLLSLVDGAMSLVDSGTLRVSKTFTRVKRGTLICVRFAVLIVR